MANQRQYMPFRLLAPTDGAVHQKEFNARRPTELKRLFYRVAPTQYSYGQYGSFFIKALSLLPLVAPKHKQMYPFPFVVKIDVSQRCRVWHA